MTQAEAADRLSVTNQALWMREMRGSLRRVITKPRIGYDPLDIERIQQEMRAPRPPTSGHWSER